MDASQVILFIIGLLVFLYRELIKKKRETAKADLAVKQMLHEANVIRAEQEREAEQMNAVSEAKRETVRMPEEGERVSSCGPDMSVTLEAEPKPQMTIEDVRKAVVLEAVMNPVV